MTGERTNVYCLQIFAYLRRTDWTAEQSRVACTLTWAELEIRWPGDRLPQAWRNEAWLCDMIEAELERRGMLSPRLNAETEHARS